MYKETNLNSLFGDVVDHQPEEIPYLKNNICKYLLVEFTTYQTTTQKKLHPHIKYSPQNCNISISLRSEENTLNLYQIYVPY